VTTAARLAPATGWESETAGAVVSPELPPVSPAPPLLAFLPSLHPENNAATTTTITPRCGLYSGLLDVFMLGEATLAEYMLNVFQAKMFCRTWTVSKNHRRTASKHIVLTHPAV
jgi:hypothetical protein